jgi:hypothetical protein
MNSNPSLAIPFQNWQCCGRRTGCLLARLGGWVETSPIFAGANVRSLAVIYVGYGFDVSVEFCPLLSPATSNVIRNYAERPRIFKTKL